jgi:TatD DNase family protein
MNDNYIIDSHCHLDLIEEKGVKLAEILQNCAENNVRILQTICTRITEIDKILNYTKLNETIYASIGVHPCNVLEQPKVKSADILELCQKHKKIIGIGETGLDYYHDKSAIELQKSSFFEHIVASQENKLPVIIHSRDADEDMMQILQSEQKNSYFPALLHCFSSSKELAKKALDLGIFISISGIVTFKNALELQEIVKFLPLDRILVETDSPYLAPIPYRGKINQPAYTKHVVEFIAKIKNLTPEDVSRETSKNFLKIFTRVSPL